jgi:hypothetical protein
MRYAIVIALILTAGMAFAKEPGKYGRPQSKQTQCVMACQRDNSCAKKCLGR